MISSSMARRLRVYVAAGLAATGGWVAPALAAGAMATGGLTSQPIGHYDFCKQHPGECSIRPSNLAPARMTNGLMSKLASVTARVNAAVKPMSDMDIYGKDEVWAYPHGAGDCEDYVLEKRRDLMLKGISLADLLITVVRKPDGEGHAVLTVRTDQGDYILDNLNDAVTPWEATGYRYLKRQATNHTGRWVTIREGNTTLVGSVK